MSPVPPAPSDDVTVSILVVDDREENRVSLRAVLASTGYHLVEASSGPEALLRLLDEDFAVLLVDVKMPGMNGFELATMVRERPRTAAVPIIFLTAHEAEADTISKAYRLGAVDYLVKPLVPEVVRAKVAVFAELHRQRKRIERQAELLVEAERRESELRIVELRLATERRYRSLADAVPQIIWTARADGTLDYANQRWFESAGISLADAGGSWSAAVHPDDQERCRAAWDEARGSASPFQVECRLRASDGTYRWHLCRGIPELGLDRAIVSWLGTFTDIEDQKRAQHVLAELKGTIDAVLDAVLIFEADGWRMLYVNEGASSLLGHTRQELKALRPTDFLAEHDEDHLRELLAPLRSGQCRRMAVETRCRRKDEREVPVEISFQIVPIDGGHVVAIARDITERKLAELEREQLYREALDAIHARDEFLSVASHELRSPLSALKMQLEMLIRPPPALGDRGSSVEYVRERLTFSARQVDKLGRLISELLDVTRIRSGRLALRLEKVDLGAIACDVVNRYREEAMKAGCVVHCRSGGLIVGHWDPLRLEQVTTNLLTNALKFGKGKPIEVITERDGGWGRLTVRDHGIGIEPEDVERIFQRFERAESARQFAGLGLGLYIVRHIVESHGGTIRVESQPGAGSTFVVDLPLELATTETPERGGGEQRPGRDGEGARAEERREVPASAPRPPPR